MTVAEAQEAVVAALEEEGRIAAAEPYEHEVPYSHRSGARIEPLVSLQWFMAMDKLAQPAMLAVKDRRVTIVPGNFERVYLDWMAGIRPWCISRQLWWGHRLPVYYCDACNAIEVAASAPGRCAQCEGVLRQEEDVLDTWFSSALWPFATLGWPEKTPELRAFYPTDVLSTARDILFLWVARMIMMGLEFLGEVPFTDVYIHSIIQAPDGRRMSKSLGTGIDPLEEIDARGADAVRFGLLAMSSSQDVRYSEEKIEQGQRLANKLFNATRFVLTKAVVGVEPEPDPRTVEDRWILSRLQRMKEGQAERIVGYDFSHAALALYDFVYGELCDWYLELVKHRLAGDDDEERGAVSATLLAVLRETVALAHPVIPFVTEELWSLLGGDGLLAAAPYPQPHADLIDAGAEEDMARAIEAIVQIRRWRDFAGATPGTPLLARVSGEGYERTAGLVARMARLDLSGDGDQPVASFAIPGGAVELLSADGLDLAGLERRHGAARARLEDEIARAQKKLANDGFVNKAPADVVDAERTKLARLRAELETL
jgi:valyl-tRNA synthetase